MLVRCLATLSDYSALHGCDMPPWCVGAIRGKRQRGVLTRRSDVLSLRLGQTTTQDGVRGLALPDRI